MAAAGNGFVEGPCWVFPLGRSSSLAFPESGSRSEIHLAMVRRRGNVMRRSCRLLASINVSKDVNQTSSAFISGRFYTCTNAF
jgi:hypothetical protein